MTKFRVLFLILAFGVSGIVHAQEGMKKGDKAWTDLEKQL
jgi:hypothetical protein